MLLFDLTLAKMKINKKRIQVNKTFKSMEKIISVYSKFLFVILKATLVMSWYNEQTRRKKSKKTTYQEIRIAESKN